MNFTQFLAKTIETQRETGKPLLTLDYSPQKKWVDDNFLDGSGWRVAETKTTHRIHFHGLCDEGETTNFKRLRYTAEVHTLTLRKKRQTKTITGGLTIRLEEIRPRRTLPESIVRATMTLALRAIEPDDALTMMFVDLDPETKEGEEEDPK